MKRFLPVAVALLLVVVMLLPTAGNARAAGTTSHTITAVVVGSNGLGLPNAKIEISNSTNNTVTTHFGYTNSSGKYVSQLLPDGNYSVRGTLSGYFANATYTVLVSQNVTLYFTMTQEKGNISGFVTTGKIPVVNATVTLSNSVVSFQTLSTTPLGAYNFSNVPTGRYLLTAGRSGYLSNNTTINITAGSNVRYDLTLQPTLGILTGIVNSTGQNGRNSPLVGVNVTLTGPGGSYHTTTGSNGMYYFTNLSQGTYTVSIQDSGYSPGQSSVSVSLAKTSYLNFTLIPLTRNTPFTFPGFIGNLDLDHSLLIVALIIVMVAVSGTLALLNKSYNWKDKREVDPANKLEK